MRATTIIDHDLGSTLRVGCPGDAGPPKAGQKAGAARTAPDFVATQFQPEEP